MTAKPLGLAAAGAKSHVCTTMLKLLKLQYDDFVLMVKNCTRTVIYTVRKLSEKLSKNGRKSRRRVPEEFWSAGWPGFQLVSYEYALMMNPLAIVAPFTAVKTQNIIFSPKTTFR